MARRKVTLRDIAERAGVSVSTVSLVLGDKARGSSVRISDQTIESVKRFALELGYQSRGIVGLLVPQTSGYFTQMIAGILPVLREEGFSVSIGVTNWRTEQEVEELRLMVDKGFDGVIACLNLRVEDQVDDLFRVFSNPNRLVTFNLPLQKSIPCATVDHESCGYLAARHLVDLGHRQIAFVGANYADPGQQTNIWIVDARFRGYVKALKEAGLPWSTADTPDEFLAHRKGATAAYCGRATWALDLLGACYDRGVRVPEDLSIVGQDDDREKSAVRPRITTVDARSEEVGLVAAKLLLSQMAGEQPEGLVLQPKLVVRDSTAPPRGCENGGTERESSKAGGFHPCGS